MFEISLSMRLKSWWHWQVEQRWVMSRFNRHAIRPGDFYEDCSYRTMVCYDNNYGELNGLSVVDGSIRSCSAFHCGPVKLKASDAVEHRKKYLMAQAGEIPFRDIVADEEGNTNGN